MLHMLFTCPKVYFEMSLSFIFQVAAITTRFAVLPYDTEGLCAKDVACRLAKHAAVQCSSKQCKMRRMNALSSAAAGGNESST